MAFNEYPYTDFHEMNLDWVIKKVKELAAAWAQVQQDWTDEQAAFANLQSWIENYFNNLDVQTEINVKLDAMVAAGTMSELIAPYVASGLPAEVAEQIGDVVAAQIGPVVAAQISAVVADQLPAVAAAAAAQEVSAWLALHVNPDTGYVIDDTFTIQGAAADAKAVGDEFTAIKSALSQSASHTDWVTSANLYNKDDNNKLAGYITYNGYRANASYQTTQPIYVYKGKSYVFPHYSSLGANNYVGYFDENDNCTHVVASVIADGYATFTADGDGYVRFNTNKLDNFMVCEGEYSASFKAFQLKLREGIAITVPVITEKDTSFFTAYNSVNLFDKNSNNLLEGYIGWNGYHAQEDYLTTQPIKVTAGQSIKLPHSSSLSTSYKAAYYDETGTTIGTIITGTNADGFDTFEISADGYVRFNLGKLSKETFMVCESANYPDHYVPYLSTWKIPNMLVDSSQISGGVGNPLYGKKITLNGDSICAGAGAAGGYGLIIANNNNMSYQNIAVGGGTIASGTMSGDTPRHHVCETISNMDSDADYAIIEGGVNDASLTSQVSLGTLSSGYDAVLDTTTFYGAMESCCKQITKRFKGKKYGYIAVHKMTNKYNSDFPTDSYYYAALEVCKKWGVPVCDLNVDCPPFGYFTANSGCTDTDLNDIATAYTYNGDGWHPNADGYNKYYVDKITAWMKTL